MEVIQYTESDKKLELLNRPIPKIVNPSDILIRVIFAGISKLDTEILEGHFACNPNPFVMGNQFCGVVADIGEDVTIVRPKDKVVVNPYSSCEVCNFCRLGTPQLCLECRVHKTYGVYKDGGWADYVVVPQKQVYRLPESVLLELGIFTQPMSTVIYSYGKLVPITADKRILVVGLGVLGLLWTILLHYKGYRNVVLSELNLARHEYVQRMNIDFEIISPKMVAERQQKDDDFFFDVIIECSSSTKAIEQSFSLLNSGGKLCILNQLPSAGKISISPYDLQWKELKIIGVSLGAYSFAKSLAFLECVAPRYMSVEHMGVKMYPLKDFRDALEHVRKGSVLKGVFCLYDKCKCKNRLN